MEHFTIEGPIYNKTRTFPDLNDYIGENRRNRYAGAQMKKTYQEYTRYYIAKTMRGVRFRGPVNFRYEFYEADRRRDKDNIASFAMKVVQDALVQSEVLPDDGWTSVNNIELHFHVDKARPRIEVYITEASQEGKF